MDINDEIFKITGDPFVDTGALVLQSMSKRFPEKTLYKNSEFVTNVYINMWYQKLHSVFHTNSKIMNPSRKGRHKEDTLDYLKDLINESKIKGCIEGFCKTCGKRGILYANSRSFFPIVGSGAFVNFHHAHEQGIYICNNCSIKLFFLPLGVIQLGKYIGLLHTQSVVLKNYWIKHTIQKNFDKISINVSESILHSKYKNPKNALFYLATDIITEIEDEDHTEFLQFFHFTNFGAEPNCDIYVLPNPVFNYLNKVIYNYRSEWHYFIRRFYRIKKAEWDQSKLAWSKKEKKEIVDLNENDYLNNNNTIFERLLANKSILKQMLFIYKIHFQHNLKAFPLMIAIYYVKEVLRMEKKQIELIRNIADVVINLSQKEKNYKKYLVMLEGTGKAYQFRGALLRIIKANYKNGAKEPAIRLEDYVNYLFPDGQYWGEVRDLLLIHLYERLHDLNVNADEIPEENILETESN